MNDSQSHLRQRNRKNSLLQVILGVGKSCQEDTAGLSSSIQSGRDAVTLALTAVMSL